MHLGLQLIAYQALDVGQLGTFCATTQYCKYLILFNFALFWGQFRCQINASLVSLRSIPAQKTRGLRKANQMECGGVLKRGARINGAIGGIAA